MKPESRHQCLIYDGPPSRQLPALAAVMQQKLGEGYRGLYLNTPNMVAGLRYCLAAKGMDVAKEVAEGRLVLSSESTLSEDGSFDGALMLRQLESALDQALGDGFRGLFATGDMTWEFGPERNFAKLFEYECGLEKLFRKRQELGGICQYHKDTLPTEVPRQALLAHGTIFINETFSCFNPHYKSFGSAGARLATDAELDEMVSALCRPQGAKS